MQRESRTIERVVQRVCTWLEEVTSRRGVIAIAGDHMAGTLGQLPFPVDRRLGASFMSSPPGEGGARRGFTTPSKKFFEEKMDPSADEKSCSFWAYCNMTGYPCAVCGGSNDLGAINPDPTAAKSQCPANSNAGYYWSGCCKKPDGDIRYVAWLDCGRRDGKRCVGNACNNYPGHKDWTLGAGTYYCTVAVAIASKDPICDGSG